MIIGNMPKIYSEFGLDNAAAAILADCAEKGKSTGWASNTIEELHVMETKLAPFNVKYVNDFYGEWAVRPAQK
jgi:hypothetical protein